MSVKILHYMTWYSLHGRYGALNPNAPCMKDRVCTMRYRNLHKQTEFGIHFIEDCHERMAEADFSSKCVTMSKLLQLLVTTPTLMCLLL